MASPRTLVPALILAALVAFEAAVLAMIATPNVSEQYRAYFIDRTTDCWPREASGKIVLGKRLWFLKADARRGAEDVKVCGWLGAAGAGTWSVGPQSRLRFDVGKGAGPLRLELDLVAYVKESHPLQRVALSANGEKLAEFTLHAQSERLHSVVIPAGAIGEDGRIELVLDYPDAQSPRDLGVSRDTRRLAIRLISLKLSPAGAATDSPPPA